MANGKTDGVARRTRRATPARRTREDGIVEAAARLFLAQGIGPVKMTDVADAAGVGVASLYRYFGTKVELAIRVATLLWRELRADFVVPGNEDGTGRERLGIMLGRFATTYRTWPELFAFLDEFDRLILSEPQSRDRLGDYDMQTKSFYTDFFQVWQDGVADGTLRGDVDFHLFYLSSVHALTGIAEKLTRGEVTPSDNFSQAEDEISCVVDMAMAYISREEA